MDLVPYNLNPEYSVEEIYGSQHLVVETIAQPSSLLKPSVQLLHIQAFCVIRATTIILQKANTTPPLKYLCVNNFQVCEFCSCAVILQSVICYLL